MVIGILHLLFIGEDYTVFIEKSPSKETSLPIAG
jgi:hypothetical protein